VRPLSSWIWHGAATLASPALRVLLHRRLRRGKEIADRLPERFGQDHTPRPGGRLVWLHAASVGEAVSVLPVLSALVARSDDVRVLLTTGTVTSATLLARRLPELGLDGRVMHRFVPLDVPGWGRRFLDHWRPDAAAFVESELWPNLVAACDARAIPLMLLNARMSPRSHAGWRRAPGLARTMLGAFASIRARSEADGERLRSLGARHVVTEGDLKFAAPPLPADPAELARLQAMLNGRPVWLAASTHPGEDEQVLATHRMLAPRHDGLLTIIVPRHPERGSAIAALDGGLAIARRAGNGALPARGGVYVADTLGELGLFYRLGGPVFVGGSLVPHGGQNPLEPARLGCAVAMGPHVHNFAEPVAALAEAGALDRVSDAAGLAGWVDALLTDTARRAAMGAAGALAADRWADLPGRSAEALLRLMERT
jgi:3-deoxy-D-manno-octulosonic-acid transferase